MEERIIKLLELKNIVETNSEDWDKLLSSEMYFFGSNGSSCRCKTATLRSKLNNYYQLYKGELDTIN